MDSVKKSSADLSSRRPVIRCAVLNDSWRFLLQTAVLCNSLNSIEGILSHAGQPIWDAAPRDSMASTAAEKAARAPRVSRRTLNHLSEYYVSACIGAGLDTSSLAERDLVSVCSCDVSV